MMRPARARSRPLRFRRSVVRDLRNRIRFALVGLLILIGLHVAAMMAFEGLSLGEAVWLTFTTITTTGYGDLSAKTPAGRAATIVLIYLSGIFLLTQAGGAFFEFRILRRERALIQSVLSVRALPRLISERELALAALAVERALRSRAQFVPGTRLDSWLFRITRNLWIDEARSRQRRAAWEAPPEAGEQQGFDGAADIERSAPHVAHGPYNCPTGMVTEHLAANSATHDPHTAVVSACRIVQ